MFGPVTPMGAPRSQRRGHGFKSRHLHQTETGGARGLSTRPPEAGVAGEAKSFHGVTPLLGSRFALGTAPHLWFFEQQGVPIDGDPLMVLERFDLIWPTPTIQSVDAD